MPRRKKGKIPTFGTTRIVYRRFQRVYEDVKICLLRFNRVFVVTHDDPNSYLQNKIHAKWLPSRFVCNRIRVLSNALEVACEKPEYREDFKRLILSICAPGILLFTNLPKEEVINRLKEEQVETFGGAGVIATRDYVLNKGPHREISKHLSESLRMQGVPTTIVEGVVTLSKDYEVCKKGLPLTRPQYTMLKMLDIKLPRQTLRALGCWSREKGFEQCFDPTVLPEQPLTNEIQPVLSSANLKDNDYEGKQDGTVNIETFHFVEDDIDDID